jgi:hypothetical protein
MRTEAALAVEGHRPRLAGDILWLGVTASVSAVIVGIVCWSLAAGFFASAASGRPTDAVVTAEIADTSTGGVPTTSIPAKPEPADIKSSLRDPLAVRLPNPPLSDSGALVSVPGASQPTQSASVPPAAHALGPHRPVQHHRHPGAATR